MRRAQWFVGGFRSNWGRLILEHMLGTGNMPKRVICLDSDKSLPQYQAYAHGCYTSGGRGVKSDQEIIREEANFIHQKNKRWYRTNLDKDEFLPIQYRTS